MYDQTIIFCRDGVMRIAYYFHDGDWQQALLPLFAVEKVVADSLFLPALMGHVEVESDTPLRAVMNALRGPWLHSLSTMLDTDLAAYIEETNRPLLAIDRLDIVHILVEGTLSIEPRTQFITQDPGDPSREATETRTVKSRPFVPLNDIAIELQWYANAYEPGEELIGLGVSEVLMNQFAHAPVIINDHVRIVDQTQLLPGHMDSDQPMLNPASPLVEQRAWGRFDGRALWTYGTCRPTFQHFMSALVRGLCAFKSPTRRAEYIAEYQRKEAIAKALDKQDGAQIARGGFDAEAGDEITVATLDIIERVKATGVTDIIIRPAQSED